MTHFQYFQVLTDFREDWTKNKIFPLARAICATLQVIVNLPYKRAGKWIAAD